MECSEVPISWPTSNQAELSVKEHHRPVCYGNHFSDICLLQKQIDLTIAKANLTSRTPMGEMCLIKKKKILIS